MLTLRRVTHSQSYLPFIDGLRFFAILPVVLVHYVDFYAQHTSPVKEQTWYNRFYLDYLFGNSDNGVFIFFAISGFILAMPFAKSIFNKEATPKLKDFYLRRVTRLEPPYLLVLTALFLLNVFIIHRDTLANTLPHYFASFFYLHNIVYHAHPTLNFVFWTLEIEVQFYLLAPFLANIFRLKTPIRRFVLLTAMLFFAVVNQLWKPDFLSLYNYLHFFIAGFLALDLFLTTGKERHHGYDLACFLLVFLIYTGTVTNGILLVISLTMLLYFSSRSVFWEKLLSLKWLSIIGGMCYSIYMLHQPLMAVFLNRLFGNEPVFSGIAVDFVVRLLIVLVLVLVASIIFFVLVERPCMQRQWYQKLLPSKKHKFEHR